MNSPTFKGEATELTEIKIGYDADYIYAAGKFYDSDPSGIRATSYQRDGSGPGDDHFAVILDSYNDNETALGFFTTPAGIRNEASNLAICDRFEGVHRLEQQASIRCYASAAEGVQINSCGAA